MNALSHRRTFLSSKLVAPAPDRRRSLAPVTNAIDTTMASITGIDGRRSHLGAQPSSSVSRVVSVPFRTASLPLMGLDCGCWKADTEIESRERRERSSILRHGQAATRTRSSGSAHASCRLNDEPHDQSGDDEQHQFAHSRSRSPVTRGTWGLPIAPPDVRSYVRDYRSLNRHRPGC